MTEKDEPVVRGVMERIGNDPAIGVEVDFNFDGQERKHVHVRGGGSGRAKLWLEPEVGIAAITGYTARDASAITATAREYREALVRGWIEECGRQE